LARKILLADDSVTAQNMGRKILADAGYEVIAVNNGSAALKKIAELKPDLVILDVYMPGYSGLEVCQRLKESQETARIPVLLSVGKLEPFKPEEAQRVRADGFIVKPFEASELLSALSKLEDKVVPRAEPSKPGRFARAMAAAEEADRGSQIIPSNDENGWKSRIGFPKEKTEPETKVADESPIYNPVNRDLRTIVESAAEKAAEKTEEKQLPAGKAGETIADVAALAQADLPKDVTPEEVAAIAAAAAQIQIADAIMEDERQVSDSRSSETEISERRISETQISETTSQKSIEPPSDRVEDNLASPVREEAVREEAKTEALQENKIDGVAGEPAATETDPRLNDDVRAEETQDLPVTMAAATAESVAPVNVGESRWAAVPAELGSEEATASLELEMQKAYAAFVPAEADPAVVATAQEVEAPLAENSSSPEVAPVEAHAGISPTAEFAEPNAAAAPVAESVGSAAEIVVPDPAGLVAREAVAGEAVAPEAIALGAQELQPAPDAEPAMAESATPSRGDFAPIARGDDYAAQYKPDSETVKSTAAAWASWRQMRDTRKDKDSEVAQAQSREFEVSESAPAETAARAVAAGAEQILHEVTAAPKGDPAEIARIVESVLADLRPKLMEEISRKMAEKK
jgi:CheY-like chemotaxis protein